MLVATFRVLVLAAACHASFDVRPGSLFGLLIEKQVTRIGLIGEEGSFTTLFSAPQGQLCPEVSGPILSISDDIAYAGLFRDYNSANRTAVLAEVNLTSGTLKGLHDLPMWPFAAVIADKLSETVVLAGQSETAAGQMPAIGKFDLTARSFSPFNLGAKLKGCRFSSLTAGDLDSRKLYLSTLCPGGHQFGQLNFDTGEFTLLPFTSAQLINTEQLLMGSWAFSPESGGVVGVGTLEEESYPQVTFRIDIDSRPTQDNNDAATVVLGRKFPSPSPKAPCQLQSVSALQCATKQCTYTQAELIGPGLSLMKLAAPPNRTGGWGPPSFTPFSGTLLYALAVAA
jgi:hypothetical protein